MTTTEAARAPPIRPGPPPAPAPARTIQWGALPCCCYTLPGHHLHQHTHRLLESKLTAARQRLNDERRRGSGSTRREWDALLAAAAQVARLCNQCGACALGERRFDHCRDYLQQARGEGS